MTTQDTLRTLAIGEKAPDFSLPATDGQTYSLASFGDSQLLVVIFLANHCPYVGAWEDRIIALAREFGEQGVAFAGISSNDASRFPADSFDKMRERVEEHGYPFPYLYDEQQTVARRFGATRTPEVFVFDTDRLLRYHGAVDSDWEEEDGNMQLFLREALQHLIDGREAPAAETPPVGCTIKYRG